MKPQQRWKKSFMGIYHTRSLDEKFWEKVDKKSESECWVWLGAITDDGYGSFWSKLSHRVAWELTYGPIPKGKYICHHCDNPSCVNPSHLFLGTQLDNMQDMVYKGRSYDHSGENNPKVKLSELDVLEIRRLSSLGVSAYKLSKMFLVSATNIHAIIKRQTWKQI